MHTADAIAYQLLYVDNIILTTSSTILLQYIITKLGHEFSMTDLGPLNYFFRYFCHSLFYRLVFITTKVCQIDPRTCQHVELQS